MYSPSENGYLATKLPMTITLFTNFVASIGFKYTYSNYLLLFSFRNGGI